MSATIVCPVSFPETVTRVPVAAAPAFSSRIALAVGRHEHRILPDDPALPTTVIASSRPVISLLAARAGVGLGMACLMWARARSRERRGRASAIDRSQARDARWRVDDGRSQGMAWAFDIRYPGTDRVRRPPTTAGRRQGSDRSGGGAPGEIGFLDKSGRYQTSAPRKRGRSVPCLQDSSHVYRAVFMLSSLSQKHKGHASPVLPRASGGAGR